LETSGKVKDLQKLTGLFRFEDIRYLHAGEEQMKKIVDKMK
jgi:hypothetical protein